MGRLKIFIDRVLDHGGRFRQDFPPQCVPIRRGEVVADLAGYVAAWRTRLAASSPFRSTGVRFTPP
jgi:hypothetical protein